ncbi:T9SS type A sorting domain-containing protein [Aequorivita antarctica]|uniref:T9SS type A sorting domain-containing protein n=1 Tax=Aequorivita antarctica TaxID=153266 RepID=A0A5C6Z1E5_9FLAO|nr:T9SS type A sorting domain-containing protein [Aequorivita antarctica]TXD73287.1 T9SS type A sorting domain-containing protein [Aequorivita antarctica]SRX74703.1 hypothetical protein AEQU3_01683 [Aequorivita antarctica]
MKKFTLLVIIFLGSYSYLFSQFQVIGSSEYGRIFNLTYDKNVEDRVYAITQGNHIIFSNDNGFTWDILYAHPEGELDDLKFISSENALSFVTKNTENYGLYIYDLDSGAITKSFYVPEQGDRERIKAYSIWEGDTDVALVIQDYKIDFFSYSKVHYTIDGGENWTEVYYSNDNLDYFPENVAISPDNQEKLFIARGISFQDSAGGLLISEDGGQTWTEKLTGICFKPITFYPENPQEIWLGSGIGYGNDHSEGLYKSIDGGETWNLISIPWTPYIGDNISVIEINPSNLNNIIVLEENEIAISNDGGENWDLFIHPDVDNNVEGYFSGRNASFNPFNENEIFINSTFFPLFSTNKGVDLERLKTSFFKEQGNLKYFNKNGAEHLYYGVQYGFVHKNLQNMEEDAYNLTPLNSQSFTPNTVLHIDKNIEGRVYVFSPPFDLKVSENHGEDQNIIYTVANKNEFNAVSTLPNNQNIIYVSFSFNGDIAEIKKIDFTNINSPQITNITVPQINGRVMNIHLDPTNSNSILISQGGRIFKSFDGGSSWINSSIGLEVLNEESDLIIKLIQNSSNQQNFTIATSKGIFQSFDSGETWGQIYNSFSNNIAYSEEGIIATTSNPDGTHLEIIYSQNNGQTWENIEGGSFTPINLSHVFSSTDFHFHENFADIYLGTSGLGVLKYILDLTTLKIIDVDLIGKKSTAIYPNPTNDWVNIQSKEEIKSIEIYNLAGQKIITNTSTRTNVSYLNKGIYLVKILLMDGRTEVHKLIKN